jgi:hypothetical protein
MALEIEMTKCLPATLGIAAMLIASTSLAQARSELEKSSIKAATDCVTSAAVNNLNITTLYREKRLNEVTDWVVLRSSACDNPLRAMRLLHDRLYGEGTGQAFLRGDYLADLPRAVGERLEVLFDAQGRVPPPPTGSPTSAQAVTIQGATHNGSQMAMLPAPGGGLVVQYALPRPDLNGVVMPGTVLVRGHWQGPPPQVFVGEAFVFSRLCGAIPYPVRGTVDQSQVLTLFGGAPQFDTSCRIVGYDINSQHATLRFEPTPPPARVAPPVAQAPAMPPEPVAPPVAQAAPAPVAPPVAQAPAAAPPDTTNVPPAPAAAQAPVSDPSTAGQGVAATKTLGADSLPKIVDTYRQNEARFKRDYQGKQFESNLPFRSARESMFFADQYMVGFGTGGFTSDVDCVVSDKAVMNRIVDWNKGDRVKVSGIVKDVTMGSVQLDACSLSK